MHDFPPQQQKPGGEVLRSCVSFPVSKSFQHSCALSPLKNPSWMSPANFWKYQTSSAPTLLIKHPGNHFSICLCMSPWKYCRSQSLVVFCSYTYENIRGPQMCLSEKKNQTYRLCLWMKGRLAKSGQVNLVSESLRWMSTTRTSWQIFQNCLYFCFVHMVNYSLNQWATTHELCIYVL